MAIIEHVSNNGVSTSYTNASGSNRLLVMIVSAEFSSPDNITGVTWGGKSLTSIVNVSSGASVDNETSAFYLNESNIAAHSGSTVSISCTTGGSNIRSITVEIILLSGVLQSTPISESVTKTASSTTTISITSGLSSDNKDMVIAAATSSKNNITFTTGGTGFSELADVLASQHCYTVSTRSITSSATSSSPSFTGSASSTRLAMLAFEVNSTFDPLPVEFISFEAVQNKESVQLSWTVAAELNNDQFEIEHSLDGINWMPLLNVPSIGNHTHLVTYTGIDDKPVTGINYYRLLQKDLDGTISVLAIKASKFDHSNKFIYGNLQELLKECRNASCIAYDQQGSLVCKGTFQYFLESSYSKVIAPVFLVFPILQISFKYMRTE